MAWRPFPPRNPRSVSRVSLQALLVLAGFAAGQPGVFAQPSPPNLSEGLEFSAKVVWKTGEDSSDALLFAKPDRYRLEHRGGVKTYLGYAGVTIVRRDKHEVWYVVSKRRMYLAVPLRPGHLLPLDSRLEGEISRTLIGDATAGGRAAKLYEVTVQRYGRREAYFEWVDGEHGLLLKLLSKHRDWSLEYQHVIFSKQPEYYFEVPRGYQRVDAQVEVDQPG